MGHGTFACPLSESTWAQPFSRHQGGAGTDSKSSLLASTGAAMGVFDNTAQIPPPPLLARAFVVPSLGGHDEIVQTSPPSNRVLKDVMVPSSNTAPTAFLAGNCSLGARCDNFGGVITPPLDALGLRG